MSVFDRQRGGKLESIEDALVLVQSSGKFKVLRTVEGYEFPGSANQFPSEEIQVVVILDTETTGPEHNNDLLQLSMIKISFHAPTGTILSIDGEFNQFNDPGYPVPEEITSLTGITTEMVRGKSLDMASLGSFIDQVDLFIAHKAEYDRMVCEASIQNTYVDWTNTKWACSLSEIDWKALGYTSAKLDYLLFKHGFVYDAHRADIDCRALLVLLDQQHDNAPLMKRLHESSTKETHKIWAIGAPFEFKDILRSRGYVWGDGVTSKYKAWSKVVDAAHHQEELAFLNDHIYNARGGGPVVESFNAYTRYSTLNEGNPLKSRLAPS